MLHRCANNPFHEQADMFILVVLSHGRDGKIITSGGREFPIESLYEQFNNQMCPLLKGKPKFFIIQVIEKYGKIIRKTKLTKYIYIYIYIYIYRCIVGLQR